MGNPFAENSNDLLVLDNIDLADPAVIDAVRNMDALGQDQYDGNERLVDQTKPIQRNSPPLFSRPPVENTGVIPEE